MGGRQDADPLREFKSQMLQCGHACQPFVKNDQDPFRGHPFNLKGGGYGFFS